MLTEPAFTETELALRWNISPKTLQRWRCEGVGPPYIKLSKAAKADATARRADTGRDEPPIKYPILSETDLCSRWNLSPKTLQRWRSEGIGPPAWHIGKSVRYLLMEVEAFERKAQVASRSSAGRALSESSPTARADFLLRQGSGRHHRTAYLLAATESGTPAARHSCLQTGQR